MSYIGQHLPPDAFHGFTTDTFTGDGSATTFTLSKAPFSEDSLIVVVDNVIQQPTTNFTVSGTTLTIVGTAILSGITGYAIHTGGALPIGAASSLENSTNVFTIGAAGTASSLAGIPFYNGDTTSIYTHDVSGTDSTATHNTAYGITAMDAITTGDANTAIGWSAGSALNTGTQNTIVGKGALASASSAGSNTAIGWNAAYAVTTGTTAITAIGDGAYNSAGDTETHNIAIGVNAMAAGSLAGAEYNIAIGNYALDALTSGDSNLGIGYNAGTAITTGNQNVSVGNSSLATLISGVDNTAIGYYAGAAAVSDGNVFIGCKAGETITSGGANIAIGANTLDLATTEAHNIAIGYQSMTADVNGAEYNVAIGNYALDALTTGDENVIIGDKAGTDNTTGNSNTFVGSQAGTDNTTGYHNTIIGRHAGLKSTTGNENTFVGVYAGYESIGASNQNSFFGDQAGYNVTSGDNNVCVGYQAGTSASPTQLTTGSNRIILGNNSTTNCDIKVDWTVTSDKRDKTDVEAFNMGLDFVNALNPVTYRWDMRSDYENGTPDGTHKKPKLFSGLIAQDVEILEREYGYKVEDDTAVITSVNENGNYGLTYSKFVPILINAVKELSAEIKALKEGN